MGKDTTFKKKGVIEETYFQEELVHKYPYYSIYKEFYEDGYIKKRWCFKKYDTTLDVPIIDIKES